MGDFIHGLLDKDDDAANGAQIDLDVGDNEVTATVTLGDENAEYTITVTRPDDAADAPQRLEAMSPEAGVLDVTWRSPANSGRLLVDGYQYKVDDGDWTDVADADVSAGGGSQQLTDLVDGVDVEISVRAWSDSGEDDDAATEDVDESKIVGEAASITATSWPDIASVVFDPTSVDEVEDEETEDVAENESTLTITMSGRAFADFDVTLSVADDDHAGLVSFNKTVTIRRGQISAEVDVTAEDDEESAAEGSSTAVTFEVELAPAEAEDRDATEAVLTINDDEDATDTTDPTTPPTPTGELSAPPNLAIASSASGTVELSWGHPTFPADWTATGYQYRRVDNDPAATDWAGVAVADVTPAGGTQQITNLQDGRLETFWVRAIGTDPEAIANPATDDPETPYVNEATGVTFGDSASVSGASWPAVTAAFVPTTINEKDLETTANVDDTKSTLTISVSGQVYQSFDVTVAVSTDGDGEEDHASAVSFDNTQVTIPVGSSPSATIEVTAKDDVVAGEKTIVVDVALVPAEAASRDPVNPGTALTIQDATDVAPGAPTAVAASAPTSQSATASTRTVTWTAPTAWGSGDDATRGFEYRTYVTNDGGDDVAWIPVTGGAAALSVSVSYARPAAGGSNIGYTTEVRAVTEAGASTPPGSATHDEIPPS